MEKRNNWFVNYQSIDASIGQRDVSFRKEFFYKNDFENKNVLDIGCNMGQMCKFAYNMGANNVLGLDYDASVIKVADSLLDDKEKEKITYLVDDIDNYLCFTNLKKVDTILLLSVVETLELKNRYGMLAKLSALTNVMYLEGHVNSVYSNLLEMLLNYTLFTTIEFKGYQYDNANFKARDTSRHVFRCAHEKFMTEDATQKILTLLETKERHVFSIIGNGGTGKTTFKHRLIDYINEHSTVFKFNSDQIEYNTDGTIVMSKNGIIYDESNSICIIDDVKLPNFDQIIKTYKFVICVDYRAMEYISGVNSLFYMNYDINERFNNRELKYKYDRSPTIYKNSLKTLENVYHITRDK